MALLRRPSSGPSIHLVAPLMSEVIPPDLTLASESKAQAIAMPDDIRDLLEVIDRSWV